MENKILEKVKYVYFMAVAIMMYYFITEYLNLGLHVTMRHVFALVLFFSATLLFLLKPNIARGITVFKDACIYSTPLLVITVVSMFIWFVGTVDVAVISRGLSASLVFMNMLSSSLGACALLYVFGKKGIWYNLVAILIANLIMIATIIAQNGLGTFMSELVTLIITFADSTGDIIVQAEIHELAFCLGAYLIYMLYKPKKNIVFYVLLFLSLFCFIAALKRIAIIAIAIALFFGYLLKFIARYNPKTANRLITIFTLVLILILVGYIVIIKMDTFALLEQAGINTSGRVGIYDAVDDFYEFSPGFLGHGIDFLAYQLTSNMSIGVHSVHNDFLQHYIDLGFWGYLIWLVSITLLRIWYFGRKGKTDTAIITFILTVYLIVVSSTDNTINYPLLTGTLAVLMCGHSFSENVRNCEDKIFGYVSPENKEESDSLL